MKFAALMVHLSRQWPKPQGIVLTKRDLDFDILGQEKSNQTLGKCSNYAAEQSFLPCLQVEKLEVMTEQGIYTASQDYYWHIPLEVAFMCCHEYVELALFGPN